MSQRALREAFIAGARAFAERRDFTLGPYFNDYWEPVALEMYPPKTVERPREIAVNFKGYDFPALYRFVDGEFQIQTGGRWESSGCARFEDNEFTVESGCFEPASVIALMGLIDNPTETVELED